MKDDLTMESGHREGSMKQRPLRIPFKKYDVHSAAKGEGVTVSIPFTSSKGNSEPAAISASSLCCACCICRLPSSNSWGDALLRVNITTKCSG